MSCKSCQCNKLEEIKKLMNEWEHDRIYFNDYDRLKKIEAVLSGKVEKGNNNA